MNKSSLLRAKFHRLRLFCRRILNRKLYLLSAKWIDLQISKEGDNFVLRFIIQVKTTTFLLDLVVFFRLTLVWEVIYLKLSLLP